MMKTYLVLADGHAFEGVAIGKEGATSIGELVFTTGMGGYLETLSDPSYYGQIVVQTFPLIGNYGFIPQDLESNQTALFGYVTRELCAFPSNFRCEGTLDGFLKARGIPGVAGVDTRAITALLREAGVMNAAITPNPDALDKRALLSYHVERAVRSVTCQEAYTVPAAGEVKRRVTLIDYGAKGNIIAQLCERGCEVTVVPASTDAQSILAGRPDGVMLSNGPGDPAENVACIRELQTLMGKVPMFGICLGHQLLALANGYETFKLKYGHRGVNQPVRDAATGRVYITSQNHGYAVKTENAAFVNANDGTCEGLIYPNARAFSVQFHPEACSGPRDTRFLFDRFMALMEGGNPYAA